MNIGAIHVVKPRRESSPRNPAEPRGFTLMEVLLVLVILVVLASMAVTIFGGTQERALKDAAKGAGRHSSRAPSTSTSSTRRIIPAALDDLITQAERRKVAERWEGPYLDGSKIPLDPWDNEYKFAAPGKHNPESFDVWSMGPDGQDGTDDDIGNWES